MDAVALAAFEERASAAEARIAALEKQLLQGGAGRAPAGTVDDLLQLRQVLVRAKAELEAAQKERDQAVADAGKLRYQVVHLKRAVVQGDDKLAKLSSQSEVEKLRYQVMHLKRALQEADEKLAAAKKQ